MTIEKAIEILQSLWCYKNPKYSETDIRKALDIAIKSLKKSNEKENVDRIIKRYRIGK